MRVRGAIDLAHPANADLRLVGDIHVRAAMLTVGRWGRLDESTIRAARGVVHGTAVDRDVFGAGQIAVEDDGFADVVMEWLASNGPRAKDTARQ